MKVPFIIKTYTSDPAKEISKAARELSDGLSALPTAEHQKPMPMVLKLNGKKILAS
jgi:hypothetical protein